MKRSKAYTILFSLLLWGATLSAQVTIGSGIAPAKAAILEIKDTESTTDNITATTGGLGLPRVELVNKITLEPFIKTTDDEWNATNIASTKEKHTGLTVYNIKETTTGNINEIFHDGVYVWNGTMWTRASNQQKRYFYIPSFNLELTAPGTGFTKDLYAEYTRQFTNTAANPTFVSSNATLTQIPSSIKGRLYKADELDFVITYYDDTIFENVSISAAGVMTYDVKSIATTPKSHINVVFIIK